MDALIFSVAFALAAALVFLAAAAVDRKVTVALALLGALYLGLDDLVTGLASEFSVFSLPGADWNWVGKIFSLLLSALVIVALRLSPEAVGLTLRQNDRRVAIAGRFLCIVGHVPWLALQAGSGRRGDACVPGNHAGIAEELVYRGICPAILLGLIHRRAPASGTPWAVILATSVVFGIWHGLGYSGGNFTWDTMSALIPLVGSIPGGWLRFRTGSLLVPVLGHAVANVAFHVAGGLGT
jgi:uncharacterized protein